MNFFDSSEHLYSSWLKNLKMISKSGYPLFMGQLIISEDSCINKASQCDILFPIHALKLNLFPHPIELDAYKEKVEELTLDLDIIKTEMEGEALQSTSSEGGSGVTNFELKQLQAQNEKLRETLVRMRDLSAHEKSESIKIQKEFEELRAQNGDLTKSYEKCKTENETLEAQLNELQEQVDAALGAEEMVENLTTKCLDLEDKYR